LFELESEKIKNKLEKNVVYINVMFVYVFVFFKRIEKEWIVFIWFSGCV